MPQAGSASGTLHPRQDSKIFCGGLSWGTTAEKLEAYFSNFGQARLAVLAALCGSRGCMQSLTSSSSVQVLEAFVSYDRHTGRPRGFGKCLEHTVLMLKGAPQRFVLLAMACMQRHAKAIIRADLLP